MRFTDWLSLSSDSLTRVSQASATIIHCDDDVGVLSLVNRGTHLRVHDTYQTARFWYRCFYVKYSNSKPDRPHHPTTQSTSDCRISPQDTPCTAERTPTSHQEGTPSKVCLLPRQWWDHWTFPVPLPTVRQHQIQTTASSTKYTQHAIWIHYTTATNSHLQHVSHEQTWRDCPKSGGPRKVKVKCQILGLTTVNSSELEATLPLPTSLAECLALTQWQPLSVTLLMSWMMEYLVHRPTVAILA